MTNTQSEVLSTLGKRAKMVSDIATDLDTPLETVWEALEALESTGQVQRFQNGPFKPLMWVKVSRCP